MLLAATLLDTVVPDILDSFSPAQRPMGAGPAMSAAHRRVMAPSLYADAVPAVSAPSPGHGFRNLNQPSI